MRRFILALAVLGFSSIQTLAAQPLRIVLDPGHNPGQGGALGARGIYEVVYNDRLAAKIADALRSAGFDVTLTRSAQQTISLNGRARVANEARADLFLAIHHDSAQPKYLQKVKLGEQEAYQSTRPISGYSIFVSKLNPRFEQSYAFAQWLGGEMRKLGRSPALHHAEPIPGENRELLAADLGIYRFDELVVLKKTEVPAILLEVGVIVDVADEAYVADESHQQRIVDAIVAAVRRYAQTRSGK